MPKQSNDAPAGLETVIDAGGWRGICPECLVKVTGRKTFCTDEHKSAFHNRSSARGRVIIPLLMAARIPRNRGTAASRAWREARTLLDQYAKEDREAGRMSAVDYVAGKWAGGF